MSFGCHVHVEQLANVAKEANQHVPGACRGKLEIEGDLEPFSRCLQVDGEDLRRWFTGQLFLAYYPALTGLVHADVFPEGRPAVNFRCLG